MPSGNAVISALRALSRRDLFSTEELDGHIDEYHQGDDRTIAIVGGASVENTLKEALIDKMIRLRILPITSFLWETARYLHFHLRYLWHIRSG